MANPTDKTDGKLPVRPEMALRPLSEHCWLLAKIMADPDVVEESLTSMLHSSEWLQAASGIRAVEFDAMSFDTGLYLCESAIEYHEGKDRTLQEMVLQLARFSFVWGALEAYLDDHGCKKWKCPKEVGTGKIRRACWYLKHKYEPRQLIASYPDELRLFLHDVICIGRVGAPVTKPAMTAHLGKSGLGIAVVYSIRNEFAHGSLRMPEPDEHHKPQFFDSGIVERATRIVLLTLQMLFSAEFADSTLQKPVDWSHSMDNDDTHTLESVLNTLHIMQAEDGPMDSKKS